MTELEALKILKDKQQKARQAVRLDRRRLEGCKYCETGSNDFDRREICVNVLVGVDTHRGSLGGTGKEDKRWND